MADRQLLLAFPQSSSLAAADFVIADSNCHAHAWISRWPNWPGPALTVHGAAGCGKTHLLAVFAARSGALVMSGDAVDVGRAVAAGPAPVAVDDADHCAPNHERALLHLYNILRDTGRHLLLASAEAPARWPLRLADLRSRLAAAPAVAIAAPDDRLLRAIVVKLFADRQVRVGDEVVAYLLARCERSPAALRDLVARLDAVAACRKAAITVPLVRAVLDSGNQRTSVGD